MKQITIKEIAQLANVSVSTVSRVLNNHPSVSSDKREHIQKIIDEEGFKPSMLARGMVSKKTHTLAVLVPDIGNPYFTDLISNIEVTCQQHGYSVLLFNTMSAGSTKKKKAFSTEEDAFNNILNKQVDAAIILGGEIDKNNAHPDYIEALNQLAHKIPVLVVGPKDSAYHCHFLERDLVSGMTQVLHHFLALGYQRIGFIGGEDGIKITTTRLETYTDILSRYDHFDPKYIELSDFYVNDGYHSMNGLITDNNLPEAVVAMNDYVALGALRALADHQLECPKDIALASVDYFGISDYFTPRLTTVDQHNEEIANTAVLLLMKLIEQKDQPEDSVYQHQPALIIRESCGIKKP